MDNNITITLTGNKAYDFIRNESIGDTNIANLISENKELSDDYTKLLEVNRKLTISLNEAEQLIVAIENEKDALEYELLQLKENSAEASYWGPVTDAEQPTGRLARDLELAKNSEYEEAMEQAPILEEPMDEVDEDWRFFVDTETPDNSIIRANWDKEDTEVIENAINKTDRVYYSVDVLATYLNRTPASIVAKAYRDFGASTKNGMLISK